MAPPELNAQCGAPSRIARVQAFLVRRGVRRGGEMVTWLHGQADRLDLVPQEFGKDAAVDPADPRSILAEWRRQLKLWAAYNPEEIFALKAGATVLGLLLLGIVAGVALLT